MVKHKKRKSSSKAQVMPPYGKIEGDGHTSVKDIQDTGYETPPKPKSRKVPDKMVKSKHKNEKDKSGKYKDIEGTGSIDTDKKSRRVPKTADSRLSRVAAKSGYAKLNKDEDKQPKMKKKRK